MIAYKAWIMTLSLSRGGVDGRMVRRVPKGGSEVGVPKLVFMCRWELKILLGWCRTGGPVGLCGYMCAPGQSDLGRGQSLGPDFHQGVCLNYEYRV